MKRLYKLSMVLLFLSFSYNTYSQALVANDDIGRTGPYKKIKINVTKNDVIPCRTYTLSLVTSPSPTIGIAIFEGDNLVFTPLFFPLVETVVDIPYLISCEGGDGASSQATVSITITPNNLPVNIIQPGEECIDEMPPGVPFGIKLKFQTENGNPPDGGYRIDGFTSPIVGDLNGDGKPEIVMLGVTGNSGGTARNTARYINIYNGQNGERVYRYDLGANYAQNTSTGYHRPTSPLAIADIDRDGVGEIVYTRPDGIILCYKPVFNETRITNMIQLWEGNSSGTSVNCKAPVTSATQFHLPHPYIADINGDGIAEVVVYNKVFNSQTGALLMSWQAAAATATASSITNTSGLKDNTSATPTNQADATNVRSVAMTGRRPGNGTYADEYVSIPAIWDIDDDGIQEIITGNRIHKIQINSQTNHTLNTYTTIEGPLYADLTEGTTTRRHYLSDGHTRVADIDGDGHLDIIVVSFSNNGSLDVKILIYVWDPRYPDEVKAALTYYSDGANGNISIPFVGDINGMEDGWDGIAYTKKLPEICILSGAVWINSVTPGSAFSTGRTGIKFHPMSDEKLRQGAILPYNSLDPYAAGWDNEVENGTSSSRNRNTRFNRNYSASSLAGHIIGLTYDAQATSIQERLKVCWAMEHSDRSHQTGITLFDFDNDGAKDLCYRDETTLRVISPKRGNGGAGSGYTELSETTTTPGTSIMFSTPVFGGTGFEYPTIADVNLDGSADILVTQSNNSQDVGSSQGWINVYEYDGHMWAPCPPVWNQSMYNPLHIHEDLTVPVKPISLLTTYTDGEGETITPYNGSWIQQPIVIEGDPYVPVYRHPDAVLINMNVESASGNTKINISVRNDGPASINANTPIYFYHTVPSTSTKLNATVLPIGVDIFPNEKVELEFTISGSPAGLFTHCSLMDAGSGVPAAGFTDCRPTNNYGYTSIIRAVDDYVIAFNDTTHIFDIAANDTIITGGSAILEIYEGPKQGIAVITPSEALSYKPTGTVPYRDTIAYLLRCEYGGDTLASVDTSYVFIVVTDYPDNIIHRETCFAPMQTITFAMHEQARMVGGAHVKATPVVGDLDGDGIPEIVVLASTTSTYETINQINVFDGSSHELKATIPLNPIINNSAWMTTLPIALTDADRNGKGEIIFAHRNRLYSYEADNNSGTFTLTSKWAGGIAYSSPANIEYLPQPFITDFNGDGTPEVVIYNQIFNAHTGALLGTTEAQASAYMGINPNHGSNKGTTFLTAADLDGDGLPELIAGSAVYKVNISADGTTATCSVLSKNTAIGDGFTSVSDVDLDGELDVVIARVTNNETHIYVWRPDICGGGVGTYEETTIASSTKDHSFPFIGDIDGVTDPSTGKKYPEICVVTTYAITALKYNPLTNKHEQLWRMTSTDVSGATGITLFDFDNDGSAELVYRDETHLRIIDGKTGTDKTRFTCGSGTAWEYPVIADTDGDGSANICVSCYSQTTPRTYDLVIFESSKEPWTPARKVWNQVNYEPLLVNEILTTPWYAIPKNVLFNDKHPYNGALIQVPTMVNTDFSVVMPAANPEAVQTSIEILGVDSVRIWVDIENTGVKNTNPTLPVALYNTATPPASAGGTTLVTVLPVGVSIVPGDSYRMPIDIPRTQVTAEMSVRIQDDGVTFPAEGSYLDCNLDNNTGYVASLVAVKDEVLVRKNRSQEVNVLLNDLLYTCNASGITLTIEDLPAEGSASVHIATNSINYTPDPDYIGLDSLRYKISCGGKDSYAMVYLSVVEFPDNIIDADCYIDPPATVWDMEKSVVGPQALNSMIAPVVGNLDGDSIPEIVAFNMIGTGYTSNALYVYYGINRSSPRIISMKAVNNSVKTTNSHDPGAMALVKADINNNGIFVPIIIVHHEDGKLRAYDPSKPSGSELVWESNEIAADATVNYVSVHVADFNNDGNPEVYTSNRIFDAATGQLLVKGTGNSGYHNIWAESHYFTFAANLYGDERLELAAGTQIYDVQIKSRTNPALNSMTIIRSIPAVILNGRTYTDGATFVVDINQDGKLDVVCRTVNQTTKRAAIFAWDVEKQEIIASVEFENSINASYIQVGIPFVGDVDGDGELELLVLSTHRIFTYKIDPDTKTFVAKWPAFVVQDISGATGITLFDFNQDGIAELVYRDETELKILNATSSGLVRRDGISPCRSGTVYEYPIVADVDNDGHAEIITIGNPSLSGDLIRTAGSLHIIKNKTAGAWAPARKVWNQYAYNVVNINEDLTTPKVQLNPNTVFPGDDGILGTTDDIRPYNAFLQQQTALNRYGTPIWLTPDVYPDPTLTRTAVIGDSVSITLGIINEGDALIGSPVYVALYKDSVSTGHFIMYDSADIQIFPGDTGYVSLRIQNMNLLPAMLEMAIRVNDNGSKFMYQEECDSTDNTIVILNPALSLLMKKDATLQLTPPLQLNGSYSNPVSILYSEMVEYTITAVNANKASGTTVIINDTIPSYMNYVSSTPAATVTTVTGFPDRTALHWSIGGMTSMASTSVTLVATPDMGCCASQPMFINRAWVTTSDTIHTPTNYTYYQGACVGIATFSASLGGNIYNAAEQALDYRTTPHSGIVIVPNAGYRFAGWSHEDYISLRRETIKAQRSIMQYDTLIVYGNIKLQADFELEEYTVSYYLNGGTNAENNPSTYTINSDAIELAAPTKSDDVFIGWTGSNGDMPQASVVIPKGTTGVLEFYANFLHSGREEDNLPEEVSDDRIWAVKDELYIQTSKTGGMVHIYSTEGVLQKVHAITVVGKTKLKLSRGLYIVTLDNSIGQKIMIE